jgi:hypothetical protein
VLLTKLACPTTEATLLILWLVSVNYTHAEAAASSAAPLPEVTVIAPRPPTPQELAGEAIYDFVHQHAKPAQVTGQLARWNIDICPVTQGLSPAFNDFVSARILAIAASVGAPHQDRGHCEDRRNVYIFFTADPNKLMDTIEKEDGRLLGYHYPQQTERLKKVTRPIQGWYVTSSRGAWGNQSIDEADPVLAYDKNPMNMGQHPAGEPGSRLSSYVSSGIVNATIVVDINKVIGHAIGPIADYVAVLSLTQALDNQQCGTLPSIMDLMVPNCGDRGQPTGITAGDLAFLKALYRINLESILSLERSAILDNMTRQFTGH